MTEALRSFASANERSARTKMNPKAPHSAVFSATSSSSNSSSLSLLDELEEQPQAELGFVGRCGENFLFEDAKGHEDALFEQLVSNHAGFAGHRVFPAGRGLRYYIEYAEHSHALRGDEGEASLGGNQRAARANGHRRLVRLARSDPCRESEARGRGLRADPLARKCCHGAETLPGSPPGAVRVEGRDAPRPRRP